MQWRAASFRGPQLEKLASILHKEQDPRELVNPCERLWFEMHFTMQNDPEWDSKSGEPR